MEGLGAPADSAQLQHKQRLDADTAASQAAYAAAQAAARRSTYVKIAFWGVVILIAGGIAYYTLRKRAKGRN